MNVDSIERLIRDFQDNNEDAHVFSSGLCGTFAMAIKDIFPDLKYYGVGPKSNPSLHFLCGNGGIFFDSEGVYVGEEDAFDSCRLGDREFEMYANGEEMWIFEVDKPYGESVCEHTLEMLSRELKILLDKREVDSTLKDEGESVQCSRNGGTINL